MAVCSTGQHGVATENESRSSGLQYIEVSRSLMSRSASGITADHPLTLQSRIDIV